MPDQGRFPIEAFTKELALKKFEFLLTLYGIVGHNDETPVEINVVCARMGVDDIRFAPHAVEELRTDGLIGSDGLVVAAQGTEPITFVTSGL